MTSTRISTVLATAFAPAVWGTTYVVTTELLPGGDHALFAGLVRSLPAGFVALAIARQLPVGRWWGRVMVLGALNIGLFFPLLFTAAARLPGGVAAILGATQPLIVASLARLLLGEALSFWRVGWALAGCAGVAMVALDSSARLDPLGVAAGLAGAVSMALGVVLSKKWGRPEGVSPVGYAGWLLTAGGLVLMVPALFWEGVPAGVGGAALRGYLWLGLVGGLVAYTLWFRGIRVLPAAPTALLGLLSPLVAAVLGAVVLHESLSPVQLVGFAVALTALVAGQVPAPALPKKQRHPSQEVVTR